MVFALCVSGQHSLSPIGFGCLSNNLPLGATVLSPFDLANWQGYGKYVQGTTLCSHDIFIGYFMPFLCHYFPKLLLILFKGHALPAQLRDALLLPPIFVAFFELPDVPTHFGAGLAWVLF